MEDYGGGDCSWKRRGQIPVFGDWEYADKLPITRYFENARKAGLLNRHSSSSGVCGGGGSDDRNGDGDGPRRLALADDGRKVQTDHQKHRRCPQVMGSDSDLPHGNRCYAISTYTHPTLRAVRAAKGTAMPVEEDLYKIPTELHTTKRKKMRGFFSRCLVPGCAA